MVEYRLVETSPTRVVVRHPPRSTSAAVFVGSYGVAAAGLIWVLRDAGGSWWQGPLVPGLALLTFLTSIMVAIRASWRPGHTLAFDAGTGLATLTADGGRDAVSWPLTQFREVAVRASPGAKRGRKSLDIRYYADLVLEDGARLPLLRTRSERTRDELAGHLRRLLATAASRPPVRVPSPVLGPFFVVRRDAGSISVAWRSVVRVRSVLSLLAMLLSLLALAGSLATATLTRFGGGINWLPVIVLGLIVAVPALLLAAGLLHQLRTHRRGHRLRLTPERVEYTGRGTLIPDMEEWSIAREALSGVRLLWGRGALELTERPAAPGGEPPAPIARTLELGVVPMEQVVAFEQWLQAELSVLMQRHVA